MQTQGKLTLLVSVFGWLLFFSLLPLPWPLSDFAQPLRCGWLLHSPFLPAPRRDFFPLLALLEAGQDKNRASAFPLKIPYLITVSFNIDCSPFSFKCWYIHLYCAFFFFFGGGRASNLISRRQKFLTSAFHCKIHFTLRFAIAWSTTNWIFKRLT